MMYRLHDQDVIRQIKVRTEKSKSRFYLNCLSKWNKLETGLRHAPSVAGFKKKLLSIVHPPVKSVFTIHDPKG